MNSVFAFEVSVTGTTWKRVVNARTRGAAKYDYWLDVRDAWPDIPFTAIRARKLGKPRTSTEFLRNAKYRGISLKCGDRVRVGKSGGVVVGHNSSANLDVLFDADSEYPNLTLNVHPASVCAEVRP